MRDSTQLAVMLESAKFTPMPDWVESFVSVAPVFSVSIAGLALVGTIVSLCIAISGRRLAGKSYRLAENKEARQTPRLDIYVTEAIQTVEANGTRTIDVDLQITNESEVSVPLRSLTLWIQFSKKDIDFEVEVSPTKTVRSPQIDMPRSISAGEVQRGWLRFELSPARTAGWTIHSYGLVLVDTKANRVNHTPLSVRG